MGWSEDDEAEVEREVGRLKRLIPAGHHGALEKITLQRALRLYGDHPKVLANELRLVRECIQPDERNFETLLEGAFVAGPHGFSYEPEKAMRFLDSRLDQETCAEAACGVQAVNMATLEQYFRHGGVIPHYRDGKWRIEMTPYPPRSYPLRTNNRKMRSGSAQNSYKLNEGYAKLHGFVGSLAAQHVIRRQRDDHFGRQRLERADELYLRCLNYYKQHIEQFSRDELSLRPLKELLVSRLGAEKGAKAFAEASHSYGVRIVFNEAVMAYFEHDEKKEGAYAEHLPAAGSLVIGGKNEANQNDVIPLNMIFAISFNGGKRQAREFRKLLAQPTPPRSIFRMYLT